MVKSILCALKSCEGFNLYKPEERMPVLCRDRSPGSTRDCRVLPGISSGRPTIAGWPGGLRHLWGGHMPTQNTPSCGYDFDQITSTMVTSSKYVIMYRTQLLQGGPKKVYPCIFCTTHVLTFLQLYTVLAYVKYNSYAQEVLSLECRTEKIRR